MGEDPLGGLRMLWVQVKEGVPPIIISLVIFDSRDSPVSSDPSGTRCGQYPILASYSILTAAIVLYSSKSPMNHP